VFWRKTYNAFILSTQAISNMNNMIGKGKESILSKGIKPITKRTSLPLKYYCGSTRALSLVY